MKLERKEVRGGREDDPGRSIKQPEEEKPRVVVAGGQPTHVLCEILKHTQVGHAASATFCRTCDITDQEEGESLSHSQIDETLYVF